ncbi:hypothetical protein E4T44_09910 [Aureobasidium sp. EXF-8845]|nr:hypothetical protein E4T44_09910 [Aureobasidium sp. EXF-8845]
MHSFTSLMVISASLVAAQDHLAVLNADGVSVGYHADASSIVTPSIDSETVPISFTSGSPSLPSQPLDVHAPVPFSEEAVVLQPVVEVTPTASSSIDQLDASSFVIGTAPRSDGRCGAQFNNALCDPNGIYGGCCSSYGYCGNTEEHCMSKPTSSSAPDAPVVEAKPEYKVHEQPGADAAHPMGFWILNRNDMTHHISADWAADDHGQYGDHAYLQFSTATVAPGENLWIPTLPGSSPKLYVGVSPNEKTVEVGENRNYNTLVEATFSGGYGHLYYDIDIERGFSSPVWCHGQGEPWSSGHGCVADLLAVCPKRDQHHDPTTNIYDQCRESPENVQLRYQLCPKSYIIWNDDWNTKTTSNKDVLVCTIVSTPSTGKIQVAQMAEAQRKQAAGIKANAVLPRRALPRSHHSKNKLHSGHGHT